eukprot:1156890-Pelagomonas_calceolata.AAC.5
MPPSQPRMGCLLVLSQAPLPSREWAWSGGDVSFAGTGIIAIGTPIKTCCRAGWLKQVGRRGPPVQSTL